VKESPANRTSAAISAVWNRAGIGNIQSVLHPPLVENDATHQEMSK